MSAETDTPGGGQGAVSMGDAAQQPPTPAPDPQPTPTVAHEQTSSASSGGPLPDSVASLTEKPEAMVGAAFAGGLVFAMILKRLGR